MTKNNEALVSVQASLSTKTTTLDEAEHDLYEMCIENIALLNEYAKSLEDSYTITHNSFENALQQM